MSMTGEQQRNVFRMAAIIYGRSNNGISLNKSYQRVIDDALYSCGRLSIPITELIVYINKEYGFLFSVDEINNVVIKGRDADQRYYCYTENNDTIISLTGEYKNKLSLVCGQKTLYEYIDEYLISLDIEKESSKALILRFLYEMFTSNLEGYKLILQEKIDAIEVKSNNYTDKEKEIINNFLASFCVNIGNSPRLYLLLPSNPKKLVPFISINLQCILGIFLASNTPNSS